MLILRGRMSSPRTRRTNALPSVAHRVLLRPGQQPCLMMGLQPQAGTAQGGAGWPSNSPLPSHALRRAIHWPHRDKNHLGIVQYACGAAEVGAENARKCQPRGRLPIGSRSCRRPRSKRCIGIGRLLGHYRIEGQIGSGGMGVVYRAYGEHLDREVALKVLLPGTIANDSARRKVRNEALALSKLQREYYRGFCCCVRQLWEYALPKIPAYERVQLDWFGREQFQRSKLAQSADGYRSSAGNTHRRPRTSGARRRAGSAHTLSILGERTCFAALT